MQVKQGDEEYRGHHHEEWPSGNPRCVPGLLYEDVPDQKVHVAWLGAYRPSTTEGIDDHLLNDLVEQDSVVVKGNGD